jgi:hypothetical protein
MKLIEWTKMTPRLAYVVLAVAMPGGITLAAEPAPAPPQAQISVSGMSRGYTNEEVRGLIARGVEAAVADDRATATQWVFSVQAAPGNHPQTQIVATLRSGSAREVSGFFTSPNLGTAPTSLFVEEVRQFAKRLLRRSDIG